jgi:hypothetical protein
MRTDDIFSLIPNFDAPIVADLGGPANPAAAYGGSGTVRSTFAPRTSSRAWR